MDVEVGGIAADSLGARRIGRIGFEVARQHVDSIVLVSDQEIRDSQRALWDSVRMLVEPGAAAALAGLRTGKYQVGAGERVGVVVCGANTDPAKFAA